MTFFSQTLHNGYVKKILSVLLVVLVLNLTNTQFVSAAGASLLLSPATYAANVGDQFKVDILLDTGGVATTTRVKAVMSFDVNALQVVDYDMATVGTQIKPGPLFTSAATTNSVDTVAGKITYDTGVITPSYSGHGVLASVTFKALASGITRPPFVFNSSAIIAPDGSNILDSVNDGTYTISGGTETTTTTTTTPPPTTYVAPTTTTTTTTLPQTGAMEDTILMVTGGFGLLLISWVLRKNVI